MCVFYIFSAESVTSRGTSTDEDNEEPSPAPPLPRQGFWRKMMRATVPIQAVFLSSIIMSWVLDPEVAGCNGGSEAMLSALYPQLRYLNGPPPI